MASQILRQIITVISFLVVTSNAVAEGVLSPFLDSAQGELKAVFETNTFVVLIELDYKKLEDHLHSSKGQPYIARVFDKTSRTWSTQQDVAVIVYLDGGSLEINFKIHRYTVRAYLPTKHSRENGESPRFKIGGQWESILHYGGSMVGYQDVIDVIKPLYSRSDQDRMTRTGDVIVFNRARITDRWKSLVRVYRPAIDDKKITASPGFSVVMECNRLYVK